METRTAPATHTLSPTPTRTSTSTPLPPTVTSAPFPTWVTDFSDPILASVADRQPDFQDDFTQLNRGWFFLGPEDPIGPYYARLQDGALLLKLPEGTERNDSMVYNPKLARDNLVLSFDFKFGKTEPDDAFRFQFDETAGQSIFLDLSKNENWSLSWSLHNNRRANSGTYYYFSPERINVVIILHGEECAVLLNRDPLAYLADCRTASVVRSSPTAVSFHLLSIPGRQAMVTMDNVKLWELYEIPGIP
jgi:hypothetical protein